MTQESRGQLTTDILPGVIYQTFGSVPTSARDEAEHMMARLSDMAPRPVIFAKVEVRSNDDRDPDQRSVVQGTMDVSGAMLRAQVAAPTATDALRAVGDRLERRLRRLSGKREQATQRPPATPAGEWRSGDLPSQHPAFYDRPAEERRVVRHRTYSPDDAVSVSEALFDLDVLDYRFLLFTDEADGKASLVYEDEDGLFIRKLDGSTPPQETLGPDMHVNDTPAPTIEMTEAVSQLNLTNMPFVFFRDDQGRPRVLYRRLDGHYGLIVPSAATA